MSFSNNQILEGSINALRRRLPPSWSVETKASPGAHEVSLRITSSEGRSCEIPILLKRRIDPRTAMLAPVELPVLVVAPYLSQSVRDVLVERGASYADKTGNIRITLTEPGLFVLANGASTNPWPDRRRLTLRGVKAGRVVSVLASTPPPLGVRELAELAGADPGYVSRLLAMLDSQALIDRTPRGRVENVAWRKLLRRWAEDAPLSSRSVSTTWLAPRGLRSVLDRLRETDRPYLITGSAAATRVAPIAPTRLLSLYIDDPDEAACGLDLRAADAGANVILLRPADDAMFEHAKIADNLCYAPLPLVVVDLMEGPGRSPAEADTLLAWMAENEELWRG